MRAANLSTELLRTFVTVVEQNGFIKAADYLYKTQSTVSQHIKRLEQELDACLFMAQGRRRVLTPKGEMLLVYARRLLDLQTEAQLALQQTRVEDEIRLGITINVDEQLIPTLLERVARFYPGIRVLVEAGFGANLIQSYEQGLYDILLTLEQTPTQGEVLGIEPVVWAGKSGYQLPLAKPLPFAAYTAPCLFGEMGTQALEGAGIPWQMVYRANSLSGLLAFVRSGLAVGILARNTVTADIEILTPRVNLPELPEVKWVLRHRTKHTAGRLLADLLAEHPWGRPLPKD